MDWAVKRLLKFVLKRSLKHVLKTQLDLDQLQVALGQGTLELREVLLSTDYLNQQLAGLPWEFTAAFVGSVAAVIPLASLHTDSCVVRLDEVFLTLRPRAPSASGSTAAPGEPYGQPGGPAPTPALPLPSDWQGESAVAEGVKLIAGGLETLLQRMKVAASRVVLRLEIPTDGSGGCHVVTVGLAQAEYCGVCGPQAAGGAGGAAGAAVQVTKSLSFSGLTLELQPGPAAGPPPAAPPVQPPQQPSAAGAAPAAPSLPPCSLLGSAGSSGCSGAVEVRLSWGLRPHSRPHVALSVRLDPLQVHLRPGDVLTLAAVAATAAQLPATVAAPSKAHPSGAFAPAAAAAPGQAMPAAASAALEHVHPGSRSFIEGLMLPDCEGVVVEALQHGGITGQEEVDEFFDAKSLLGSLQSSCASLFMSAHESLGASMASSAAGGGSQYQSLFYGGGSAAFASFGGFAGGGGPGSPRGQGALEASLYQAHDLAASVRQLSAEEPLEWEVAVSCPALSLALIYPPAAGSASPLGTPASTPTSSPTSSPSSRGRSSSAASARPARYTPRLSIELSEVAVAAAGGAGGLECCLSLLQLEVGEHLVHAPPAARATAAAAAERGGEQSDGGMEGLQAEVPPPEEVARVPCVLPPLGFAPRPFPSSAGSYPLPGGPCDSLSSGAGFGPTLSQLSDLQASVYQSALQASMFADGCTAPRLHILPVLSCGGGGGSSNGGGVGRAGDVCALLHLSLGSTPDAGPQQAAGSTAGAGGIDATLAMGPLSLWLAVPFLERLRAFLEAVQAGLASLQGSAAVAAATAATAAAVDAPASQPPPGDDSSSSSGQQQRPSSKKAGGRPEEGTKAAVSAAINEILQDLQGLRMEGGAAPAPAAGSRGPTPLRLRAYLPHICLVAPICEAPLPPASTTHGYSYVAADMGGGVRPGAVVVQGLRQLGSAPRLPDVQELVERLSDDPAPPTLVLSRGAAPLLDPRSSQWGAAGGPAAKAEECWDGSITAGRAALFLVGGVGGEGPAASLLGCCLFAHQVAAADPPGSLGTASSSSGGGGGGGGREAEELAQPALMLDVQWSRGRGVSPTLLQDSWRRLGLKLQPAQDASEEQGRWESDGLDVFTFRQQCVQTSPLFARVAAPAVVAALTPAALAALANFADGLLQLAPQPAPDPCHLEQGQGRPGQAGAASPAAGASCGGEAAGSSGGGGGGVQVAVEVECSASCRLLSQLEPWHSPPDPSALLFSAEAAGVSLLSVGNLSGMSGGGALVLALDGLDLRGTPGVCGSPGRGEPREGTCLLHRPAGAKVDGRALPGLELVHIARPQCGADGAPAPSRLHPRTRRYYIPTDAQAAVSLAGWTLATEGGDISLSWLHRLAGFFALGSADPQAGAAPVPAPAVAPAAAPAPGTPASPPAQQQAEAPLNLDWVLEAQELALRYEPPVSSLSSSSSSTSGSSWAAAEEPSARGPVAAVVLVGSATCRSGSGAAAPVSLPLSLRCLAVHVAPAGGRQGDWTPGAPCHAAGAVLVTAGYACVATEGELSVNLPLVPAAGEATPGEQTAGAPPPRHVEVRNHLLNMTLTQHSALLLQQLARQCGEAAQQARRRRQQQQSAPPVHAATTGTAAAAQLDRAEPLGEQPGPCSEHSSHLAAPPGWPSQPAGGGSAAVDVLRGVRDDEYRRAPIQQPSRLQQASVIIDGRWYESLENEPLSPAGSPPVVVDSFSGGGGAQWRKSRGLDPWAEDAFEGDGTWFDAPASHSPVTAVGRQLSSGLEDFVDVAAATTPSSRLPLPASGELPASLIHEDYLDRQQQQRGSEQRARRVLGNRCALGELPAGYPPSLARLSLRDINVAITLSSAPLPIQHPPASQASGSRGELQLRMQRLCVQVDTFPEHAHVAQRIAASLHTLEVREQREPAGTALTSPAKPPVPPPGQPHPAGSPARLPSLRSSLDWRQVLVYNVALGAARDPEACMVAAAVEAVRPDPEGVSSEEEYRLEVALLPLRLQLEQGTVAFLQRFFAPFLDTLEEPAVLVEHADTQANPADFDGGAGALGGDNTGQSFIQRCEVQPFTVTIDYQPHSVDIAALRRGDLTEILNLFPWGGVTLQFRHLRLFGVHDAPTLGTALASAWLEDIVKYQAHKFLAGIAPIRSLCKVSSAAMQLIAIPVEHLFAESSGPASHRSLSSMADANFLRQMRRGTLALVRAIASEALGLGATVAGGAQMVLHQTRSSPTTPFS